MHQIQNEVPYVQRSALSYRHSSTLYHNSLPYVGTGLMTIPLPYAFCMFSDELVQSQKNQLWLVRMLKYTNIHKKNLLSIEGREIH